MLQVRSMRNLTCLRTLGRIFETLFLLSNEIHYMKVQNKPNIHFKMADSQNMQSKQKLSDDEKTTLINFYKENKAFWSSEVNFRNKEEKSAVKEHLLTLFEGHFPFLFFFIQKKCHSC